MQLSHIPKMFAKHQFSLFILVSFTAFTSTLLLSSRENAFAASYYVATNGNDNNNGSVSAPWRTIGNSIDRLRPGDILYLRSGIYYENNINISNQGTSSSRITIRNYPGETPTIDGGYRDFRTASNSNWQVYDSARNIYISTNIYSNADMVNGYFGSENGNYRLVAYERYSDFSSTNENYTSSGSIYVGPGLFWNSSNQRIYIRLQRSKQETSMGYTIPSNTNPCSTALYLFSYNGIFNFSDRSAYIDVDGINVRYQNNAFSCDPGAHNISIRNSVITCCRSPIRIQDGAHHIVIDGVTIRGYIPPWVAFSDVKCATQPAHNLDPAAINIQGSANNVDVANCTIESTWDGIDATGKSFGLHIYNNVFRYIRDDVVQLGSGCYDIEINNNRMIYVSKGVSRNGSGSPLRPWTKYIHHNVIDCSRPTLGGRCGLRGKYSGPNGDGMVWNRPFGRHEGDGFGGGDPWKIYNNTLVFGMDLNGVGAGHDYTLRYFYQAYPQEVYNNIFIQTMDHWISREARVSGGSQILNGNIYFRTLTNATNYLFRSWINGNSVTSFRNLSQFRSSSFYTATRNYYSPGWESSGIEANPQLDSNYRPGANSPAATGAVSLPTGWPRQDNGHYRGALPPL